MRGVAAALWFAMSSAWQNFRRNLGISLAGVFTMGLILFLVGGVMLVTHISNSVLQQQQSNASKLKVYIQDGVSLASISDFQYRLQHDPRVDSVSFENKDQAAAEENDPQFQGALGVLGNNPLPASLNLTTKQLTDLKALDTAVRATPIHDPTQATDYNPDVTNKLQGFITFITWVGVALTVILLTVSLVIIMNTIRTAVFARRTEIEIMKLVGATDWFVRWPFIMEGIIGGLIAAALSVAIVIGGYRVAVHATAGQFYALPYDGGFTIVLVFGLIFGGALVGGVGSYIGVRRHLAV